MTSMRAADLIALLGLQPHPEGGHFRETFRDQAATGNARAVSTAIYFLLQVGEVSRWHRIDAAEVWHWCGGDALELAISDGKAQAKVRLGCNLINGERPQAVVPARYWQQARSLGQWTLAGCTVAPGFEFSKFELADAAHDPPR